MAVGFYRGDAKRLLQKQIEIIRTKEHRKVVCVLDEAHLLEKETLEEFRFLLNSAFDSESQMALILVGQNELWDQKLRYKRNQAENRYYLHSSASGSVADPDVHRFQSALCRDQ